MEQLEASKNNAPKGVKEYLGDIKNSISLKKPSLGKIVKPLGLRKGSIQPPM